MSHLDVNARQWAALLALQLNALLHRLQISGTPKQTLLNTHPHYAASHETCPNYCSTRRPAKGPRTRVSIGRLPICFLHTRIQVTILMQASNQSRNWQTDCSTTRSAVTHWQRRFAERKCSTPNAGNTHKYTHLAHTLQNDGARTQSKPLAHAYNVRSSTGRSLRAFRRAHGGQR